MSKKNNKKTEKTRIINVKRVTQVNIADYCKSVIQIYGSNVNLARTIPDSRDGLKPVQRRLLYAMFHEVKLKPEKTTKCSRIIGDTVGKFYPHGDASCYGSLVAMGQDFRTQHPLVYKQGGFGTIYDSTPAAQRYTEASLSKFAWDCFFSEWDERIIDFVPNYIGDSYEPEYLPAKYPVVLFNLITGIGYGLYSGIPTYNFNEIMDLLIELIKNPNKKKVVAIPDFATGCDIVNTDFEQICNKGEGTITLRGRIDIDEDNNLHIKSVPIGVSLDKIIKDQIPKLAEKMKISIFHDMKDNSTKDKKNPEIINMDVKIILKNGTDPVQARELLFKSTSLEVPFTVLYNMVYNYENNSYSLKSYLLDFLSFRRDFKRRVLASKYSEKSKRLHMLKCIIDIITDPKSDKVLSNIMRKSKNKSEIEKKLIKEYGITDLQAEVIADFKYSQLSIESLKRYKEEKKVIEKEISVLYDKLHDESIINEEMIEEYKEAKKKFGIPRQSQVIDLDDADFVPEEPCMIVITKKNSVKKIHEEYGSIGNIESGDKVVECIKTNNKDCLLIFDSKGVYGKSFTLNLYTFPLESNINKQSLLLVLIHSTTLSPDSILPIEPYSS